MRRRISIRGCVRPSVGPSVRGSVSIKEKRVPGASYVGYPTLLSVRNNCLRMGELLSSLVSYAILCQQRYTFPPRFPHLAFAEKQYHQSIHILRSNNQFQIMTEHPEHPERTNSKPLVGTIDPVLKKSHAKYIEGWQPNEIYSGNGSLRIWMF